MDQDDLIWNELQQIKLRLRSIDEEIAKMKVSVSKLVDIYKQKENDKDQ